MRTKCIISTQVILSLVIAFSLNFMACTSNEAGKSTDNTKEEKVKAPQTPIHTAVFMNEVETVKKHIAAGTDLDQKDEYGSSPLNVAVTFNKVEVAKLLIEGGADLSVTNNEGGTALHTAAFLCRPEIVKILLENGADKSIKNNFGSTAYESVAGDFEELKPVYEQVNKDLGNFGLKLDFDYLKKTRPLIAQMLK